MARIEPIERASAKPESQRIWDEQVKKYSRMTNMKRTLAHSPAALRILMEWYTLKDEVEPFLGERLSILFSHAISTQTDCLICSTFFRRILIDGGENPDALELNAKEQAVVDFGRAIGRDAHTVSDELVARLRESLNEEQIVALTAFGAMMVATNIINNALRVDLDEYLYAYRKAQETKHGT